jgi:hypothetical protein
MTSLSAKTVTKSIGTPRARGFRLHPATRMFYKIPMPPTARRNHVFCFKPDAVIRRRIQSKANAATATLVVFEIDTSTFVTPPARSSRSRKPSLPKITTACWLPLPRVRTTFFSLSSGRCRQAHFSFFHCGRLAVTDERKMPHAVIRRMPQSPYTAQGIDVIPSWTIATANPYI